jgi:hypothetical protein
MDTHDDAYRQSDHGEPMQDFERRWGSLWADHRAIGRHGDHCCCWLGTVGWRSPARMVCASRGACGPAVFGTWQRPAVNTLMGLPPVVAGLLVYLMPSNRRAVGGGLR